MAKTRNETGRKKQSTKKTQVSKKTARKTSAKAKTKTISAQNKNSKTSPKKIGFSKEKSVSVKKNIKQPQNAEDLFAKPTISKKTSETVEKTIRHIAVAGNIGSGKTTLTQLLSKHYGWIPHFEDEEQNPYINDFYEDMPRWSFHLQIYFLNKRFRQILEIQQGTEVVIQDRTIHEDAFIFAPNLHAMGLMSTRDYENYRSFYETLRKLIKPPDLLIYLRASVPALVNQIQKRGREYEDNLRLDYLKRLNEYYEKWISNYNEGNLLIIDVDKLNFAEDKDALGEVIQRIDAQLFGLF
ncbi:MAG: deoxynucleoside kinase [Chitinophagales bacterium]|nr:deoxynucleoside kinase [Chitinophagales bacterium]